MGVDYDKCDECEEVYADCDVGVQTMYLGERERSVCDKCLFDYLCDENAVPRHLSETKGETFHLRLAGGAAVSVPAEKLIEWAEENAHLLDAPIQHATADAGKLPGKDDWETANDFSSIVMAWQREKKCWRDEEYFVLPRPAHAAAEHAKERVQELKTQLADAQAEFEAARKLAAAHPLVVRQPECVPMSEVAGSRTPSPTNIQAAHEPARASPVAPVVGRSRA